MAETVSGKLYQQLLEATGEAAHDGSIYLFTSEWRGYGFNDESVRNEVFWYIQNRLGASRRVTWEVTATPRLGRIELSAKIVVNSIRTRDQ